MIYLHRFIWFVIIAAAEATVEVSGDWCKNLEEKEITATENSNMDLFEYMRSTNMEKESPLAARMRPRTLDEVVGQEHIIGRDKLLYRAIQADKISSVIFYGPPGTGKTTLARVIANTTSAEFTQINATVAGKKDMEDVVNKARDVQGMYGKRTILFIDEIHRFNKSQQDYLLPFVEDGTIILIGATTENPYFEVNGALISRSIIFELKPIPKEAVKELLKKAVYDDERGMGSYRAEIDEDALDFLADISGGDARHALNAIELGVMTTERSGDGKIHITLDVAQECIQKRAVRYDKNGDNHYDTISAFIKSMRGSDPDAAVYYLARMLYAGESVTFIARRIMICASEDVGNADPQALVVAVNASLAVERIGMPEAQIILSQAAAYVASAPKSNASCEAISQAMQEVARSGNLPIPTHLQDAHYKGAAKLGHGIGYKYAHDYPNNYVEQQYLPYELSGREFYKPSGNGYEVKIQEHMKRIRREASEQKKEE
jgi:putative ATPase